MLIGSQLSTGDEHPPRGQRGKCKCCGFRDGSVARNSGDVRFGHYYILRHRAWKVLSQQLEADAEGLLSSATVFACSVTDPGIDDDEFICSVQNSDGIRTHYPWRSDIDAWEAPQDEQIQMIQSRRKNPDANLTGRRLRNWQIVAEFQLFEATVARDR